MSRPQPNPIFVHFGIEGGATCSHISGKSLFIGSMKGRVKVFGTKSNLLEDTIYEDDEGRKIQSISSNNSLLAIHVRGFAILLMKKPETNEMWNKRVVRKIEVDHIGFCNFLTNDEHIFYISSKNNQPAVYKTGFSSFAETEIETSCFELKLKDNVTPMQMVENKNETFICAEDGCIAICNENEHFDTIDLKDALFCIAACDKWISVGLSKSPILMIENCNRRSSPKEIFYPQSTTGCSSLTFSPNSKQLLAGFWDGSIRVFSCQKLTTLLAIQTTHNSTISSLIWNEDVVVATSNDSTVSLWNFK